VAGADRVGYTVRVASPPVTTELVAPVALVDIDAEARDVVAAALGLAREWLDMDIGWLAEFSEDRKVFRVVEGALDEWDLHDDDWVHLADSYCQRMYAGEIANAIPDTNREPALTGLGITQRLEIASYIGVPLVLPDGELRGAFCCACRTPRLTLGERDVRFMQVLARLVGDELAFRESRRAAERLERQMAATEGLIAALQARDDYTAEHSTTVVELAVAVGSRLGLADDELHELEQVALLHDIGKVGIPDDVLRKPGALDADEWDIMRRHPAIGAGIVGGLPHLAHLAPAIRAEHERWDGRGYPDGLAGESIPLASRVTFACDAFHAMVSDRPYRRAMPREDAVSELRAASGTMFWPDAVDALLEAVAAPAS